MEYVFLFFRKMNETRKERDFRIWMHQEETIVFLDLVTSIMNGKYLQEDNGFLLLYGMLRTSELTISKNLMKKIKKELRKRVDKIILDELFQNVKFEEVTEGEKRYYKAKIKQTDRKYVSAVLQQLFYTEEFQKRLEALGEETKKDVTSKFQQEYIDKAISNAKFYYRMN